METLFGGLIAILTIVATKLLDIFQKGRDHRLSLRKEYFDRKLAAAEAAVAQWSSSASVIRGLSTLYDQVSTDEERKGGQVYGVMNKVFTAQLEKLQDASKTLNASVLLYFDIDDFIQSKAPLRRFFQLLVEINDLALTEDVLKELGEELKDAESQAFTQTELKKTQKQIASLFKQLSSVLDEADQSMQSVVKLIRTELKHELK